MNTAARVLLHVAYWATLICVGVVTGDGWKFFCGVLAYLVVVEWMRRPPTTKPME